MDDQKTEQFKDEITQAFQQHGEDMRRQFSMVVEGLDKNINIVAEGHQMLSEKLDRNAAEIRGDINKLDRRMDGMEHKVERLADDLAEHRNNTETHNVKLRK